MKSLILATSNPGKIKELTALLSHIKCISQTELGITDAEETGLSFVENALLKARHASQQSGLAALADDSGLVVPALEGAPGIYSARYAGVDATNHDNIIKLLQAMKTLPIEERKAYFYCSIVIVQHPQDPTPLIASGSLHGEIALAPSGREGFGYDPVFYLPEHQCTVAQLPASIKNTISHRAKALEQLRRFI